MLATSMSNFGIAGLLVLALLVLWILIPFAVFGIKGLLRQLVEEQRRTNALLSQLTSGANGELASKVAIPEFKQPGGFLGR